jgi:hypothetical protein
MAEEKISNDGQTVIHTRKQCQFISVDRIANYFREIWKKKPIQCVLFTRTFCLITKKSSKPFSNGKNRSSVLLGPSPFFRFWENISSCPKKGLKIFSEANNHLDKEFWFTTDTCIWSLFDIKYNTAMDKSDKPKIKEIHDKLAKRFSMVGELINWLPKTDTKNVDNVFEMIGMSNWSLKKIVN